ncbi:MAG: methylmalonyl-CoA mutase family protein, partial [Candidatus Nanopelagicales bacterium]
MTTEGRSQSGFPLKPIYTKADTADLDIESDLGDPGKPPFTRGIYPNMYLGRPWTMRQYAGFGDADQSNQRYR